MLTIIILTVLVFGLITFTQFELVKKENQIAELQSALVEAYTEIEFRNLGVMK